MNKKELAKKISAKTNYSKDDVLTILDVFCDEIAETIKNGDEVKLFGFGKFLARSYGARKCYNPVTGELINLSPSVQPAFVPGPKLREKINK